MKTTGTERDSLRDLFLAADPLLQRRERHRAFVTKGEDLAVQYRAVRQLAGGGDDLRKAVRDQLFAARPEVQGAGALDQLRADAIPLPLDLPVVGLPRAYRWDLRGVTPGRTDTAARGRRLCARREKPPYHSAVGDQSPIIRAATVAVGSCALCASARTTSVCDTPTRKDEFGFYASALENVRRIPGVMSAALTNAVPLSSNIMPGELPIRIDGISRTDPATFPLADGNLATDGYFETLGVPILRGRSSRAADRDQPIRVAVINETMAKLWKARQICN